MRNEKLLKRQAREGRGGRGREGPNSGMPRSRIRHAKFHLEIGAHRISTCLLSPTKKKAHTSSKRGCEKGYSGRSGGSNGNPYPMNYTAHNYIVEPILLVKLQGHYFHNGPVRFPEKLTGPLNF